ncbi:MAG: helix-turn-helix domain-containing protein [Aminipila sp.]
MEVKDFSEIFFQTSKGVDFTVFDANKFKERLKIAREESGLNQAELANIVGVTKASISYYESPTAKTTALPNAKVLYEITKALGVSLDYLVGDTDYKTPTQKQDADNVALNLMNTVQVSDLSICTQTLEILTEIIQESTLGGIEETALSAILLTLKQLNKIISSYKSHTVEGYLLHTAVTASTLTGDHTKLISTGTESYLKEFTYEAFTPTKEIQDTVQRMVSSLQNRLLATLSERGCSNGND